MNSIFQPRRLLPSFCFVIVAVLAGLGLAPVASAAPFAIQGPGVNPSDFRITVFATNLYYPLGMARLSDGSLLTAVSQGTSYWSGTTVGKLLRLTDTNNDGIADGPGTVLFTGLPGGQTSLRQYGKLFFVTGQGVGPNADDRQAPPQRPPAANFRQSGPL